MIPRDATTPKAFEERESLKQMIDGLNEPQAKTLLRCAVTLTALSDRDRSNWAALVG